MKLNELIKKKLFTIGLHDETFDEYVAGIITDDSLEESEKREAISEFILGATDTSSESIIDDIFEAWAEFKVEEQEIKKLEKEAKEECDAIQQISDASTSTESPTMLPRNAKKQLTKEERKRRDKLLERYSYDLDEVVENEDGEAEIQYRDRNETKEINTDLLQTNRNAELVKQKEHLQREQMKKQHEEEKEKNRILLEKQQRDKEKAKRKTMKREKRSW
ncbi:hypothetical protein RclHR1_00240021 [Rhizophagus clarus]|uniref:Coiled-coil domain-containing protein 43 n=1 Tax=Rhizophagus clarus TaxID=94130 RepID=A0A2Z6QWJ1_9GLOM|nr:hypothetical protein RclHR1_00240021 [Rhizophagus clarus]GES86077.1 coiled-coil domain-containing protein 43 [Rhizophagus clarus]